MEKPIPSAEDWVTVSDFFCLVPDSLQADLLKGVIYIAPPDSIRGNELTGFVFFLVSGFDAARRIGGHVSLMRVAYRISRHDAPEPDVGYVVPERLHLIKATMVNGGPDIAVEIVSRESRARDYGLKKRVYRKAGVSEYWLIDPIQNQVQFFRLENGKYELVPLENGSIFRSSVLPGFWLDVLWLLSDQLPDAYRSLQQILQ